MADASTPAPDAARSDYAGGTFLATRRMRLSRLRHADLFDLLALGRDPRGSRTLLDAPIDSLLVAASVVESANRMYAEGRGLGLWRADDARGFLGFFSLVADLDPDEVEIGTRLVPRAWGRGYALEGGAALCTYAFGRLGLPRLVGLCNPDNRDVPPLLARLGFVPAGSTEQRGRPALRFELPRDAWAGVLPRKRPGPAAAAGEG